MRGSRDTNAYQSVAAQANGKWNLTFPGGCPPSPRTGRPIAPDRTAAHGFRQLREMYV